MPIEDVGRVCFVGAGTMGCFNPGPERVKRGASRRTPAREQEGSKMGFQHLERLPIATIAAVNGHAAGGGCELSLACDFRLMVEGPLLYGLPETSVGIIPGAGGTQRFARLLGTARTLDLVLRAELLGPAEALDLGLMQRLYPEESFRREVAAFARDLAGRAPIALAAAKRAIYEGSRVGLEQGLAIEQECFERAMRSRDAAGAMRAFLAGETYEWQGE